MTALLLFGATFLTVCALSLQSLNVMGGHRGMAFLTSFVIGGANLLLLKLAPQPTSLLDDAGFLLGGPFGVVAAMALHPVLVRLSTRMTPLHQRRLGDLMQPAGTREQPDLRLPAPPHGSSR